MGIINNEASLYDEEPMEDDHNDVEEESESDFDSDLDEEEDVKLLKPSENAIFNRDGLTDKLQDISWPENVGWNHRLSVDIDLGQEVDVNDDLKRELAFLQQASEGTRKAYEKLESMGLPFLRPSDYYAEMVKSDAHMEKVKSRLLAEKKSIEESEERRKAREAKKHAKEVQAQKKKERDAQKKTHMEQLKKWRKQREQSGFARGDKDGEMDLAFDNGKGFERPNKRRPGVAPGDRSGGKAGQRWKQGKNKMKRGSRDSKFGYGGRKGLKKQNTAETTNDFRSFNKGNTPGIKKRKR